MEKYLFFAGKCNSLGTARGIEKESDNCLSAKVNSAAEAGYTLAATGALSGDKWNQPLWAVMVKVVEDEDQ